MGHIRRQNIFNTFTASLRFVVFWLLVVIQLPVLVLLPKNATVRYMKVFFGVLLFVSGIRIKLSGELSKKRPLLFVSNHISIFEIAILPTVLRGSFVSKKEVEKWPVIGWVAKSFGVMFVDRRPSHAVEALKSFQENLSSVDYPVMLFPEGTTTNGAYVKAFKSTLFNFVENSNVTVQPVVMHYRFRDGTPISDEDLAEHFAYFSNAKQDTGPLCSKERSAFGEVFHVMMLGGFLAEITVLPPPDLSNKNRKEIAETLHKVISDKYMELKDKTLKR